MRFTRCLILGVTVTLAGGCSHCDSCRPSLLKRIFCRQVEAPLVVSTTHTEAQHFEGCDCGTNGPVVDTYQMPPAVNSTSPPDVWNSVSQTQSYNSQLPNSGQQEASTRRFNEGYQTPIIEAPVIPTPPIVKEPATEVEGTFVPDDDTGYYDQGPVNEDQPEFDWDEKPAPRIKAQPVSTSRLLISEPEVLDEVRPVPFGVIEEEPVEIHRETLPAQVENPNTQNIVLKAYPVDNHVIVDHRIADRRADALMAGDRSAIDSAPTDSFGLPNPQGVQFRPLPDLSGQSNGKSSIYYSTNEAPFEEPPIDRRIPDVDLAPPENAPSERQLRNTLDLGANESQFTHPTSYQVPLENKARVVSLDDSTPYYEPVAKLKAVTRTSNFQGVSRLRIVKPTDENWVVRPEPGPDAYTLRANSGRPLHILRMQAATLEDSNFKIAPQVSIRSINTPVIVRDIHPDLLPAVAGNKSQADESRPVFDTERLEATIRILSSRPDSDSGSPDKTIER